MTHTLGVETVNEAEMRSLSSR